MATGIPSLQEKTARNEGAGWGDWAPHAVEAHSRFVLEFLAEMGGREWPVSVDEGGDPLCPSAGSGRLVVTLHRGNWIVGARALRSLCGPVDTVAGVQLHRSWQPAVSRFLDSIGVTLHGGAGWARLCARLREGGTVVLHLDGQPGVVDSARWSDRRVERWPLGVRAAALLVARTRVPVYFAECLRGTDGRFVFHSRRVAEPDFGRARQAGGYLGGWADRLHQCLIESASEDPGSWMMFRTEHLGPSNPAWRLQGERPIGRDLDDAVRPAMETVTWER